MLFNSIAFLLFFPIVCAVYYLLPKNKWRIWFLLFASYYFYINLNVWYSLILLCSTVSIYFGAIFLESSYCNSSKNKKNVLRGIVIINVLILVVFKYTNFILKDVCGLIGLGELFRGFDILLPVGISFYIFKAISYISDCYHNKIKAENDFSALALYMAFFPQLLAGPIERAGNLLPQFKRKIQFDGINVSKGLKLMLWGYFLKLVFADRAIIYVDAIYGNIYSHNGTSILLASILYSFQIYCDFAGYSLISIGVAKAMGYDVMQNFNRPYLATSITDFWKRWHISLTKWLTDYVYIPLGGSRCSKIKTYRNILIVFFVSGLWHGAAFNFIIWGIIHGFAQIIEKSIGYAKKQISLSLVYVLRCFITFFAVTLAWIFFRLPNFEDAVYAIKQIFTSFGTPFMSSDATPALEFCALGLFFILAKDITDEFMPSLKLFDNKRIVVRYIAYVSIVLLILAAGVFDDSQFIYMQF